ncbi:M48 family metallopeptidase [Clostridium sp. DL1XJH146]
MKKNKIITIKKDHTEIKAELIYRKRKTMEIKIKPPNEVIVIAPLFLDENQIMDILQGKHSWILKKLNYFKEIDYKNEKKQFKKGSIFYYLGKEYSLSLNESKNSDCIDIILINKKNNCENIIIRKNIEITTTNEDIIKLELIRWFKIEASRVINNRVAHYQNIVGVRPIKVKSKEQKKRWGSCTSTGNVLFNWRLIMAPVDVIDYVVVHELCHLIHMNHSKDFWSLVQHIMPDYDIKKKWLKENGFKLFL